MRTARSTTSGENFGDFLIMAPSSQGKEPPQKPGRFNAGSMTSVANTLSDRDIENLAHYIVGL